MLDRQLVSGAVPWGHSIGVCYFAAFSRVWILFVVIVSYGCGMLFLSSIHGKNDVGVQQAAPFKALSLSIMITLWIMCVLGVISVWDFRTHTIPNPLLLLLYGTTFFMPSVLWVHHLQGAVLLVTLWGICSFFQQKKQKFSNKLFSDAVSSTHEPSSSKKFSYREPSMEKCPEKTLPEEEFCLPMGMGDVKFLAICGVLLPFDGWGVFFFWVGLLGLSMAFIMKKRSFPMAPAISMGFIMCYYGQGVH